MTNTEDDETILAGPVADQTALHGLLAQVRDLNLPLVSVKRVEHDSFDEMKADILGGDSSPIMDYYGHKFDIGFVAQRASAVAVGWLWNILGR